MRRILISNHLLIAAYVKIYFLKRGRRNGRIINIRSVKKFLPSERIIYRYSHDIYCALYYYADD